MGLLLRSYLSHRNDDTVVVGCYLGITSHFNFDPGLVIKPNAVIANPMQEGEAIPKIEAELLAHRTFESAARYQGIASSFVPLSSQ